MPETQQHTASLPTFPATSQPATVSDMAAPAHHLRSSSPPPPPAPAVPLPIIDPADSGIVTPSSQLAQQAASQVPSSKLSQYAGGFAQPAGNATPAGQLPQHTGDGSDNDDDLLEGGSSSEDPLRNSNNSSSSSSDDLLRDTSSSEDLMATDSPGLSPTPTTDLDKPPAGAPGQAGAGAGMAEPRSPDVMQPRDQSTVQPGVAFGGGHKASTGAFQSEAAPAPAGRLAGPQPAGAPTASERLTDTSSTPIAAEASSGANTPTLTSTQQPTPTPKPSGNDHATLSAYRNTPPASISNHVINTRIYSDGMPAHYTQPLLRSIVATLTLTLYTAWIHILYLGTLAALLTRHPPTLALFMAIWATVLLPAAPIPSPKFLSLPIWRTWRQYFHFSYLTECILDPKGHYIFAEFPHGTFPLAPLIAGTLMYEVLPELKIFGMAASSLFSVPGYRHFIAWMGSDHATRDNFHKYLNKGSVALVPGGIAEMYYQYPDRDVIKLTGRKGFVRVAVAEGKPIVPVYHFGNTRLLDFGPRSWEWIGRKLRVAFGLTHGRWGLPVPRRLPLMMVVGPPVEVPQVGRGEPGFEAAVEEVHGRVVAAVKGLYDRHKEAYGWGDRPLVVV